MSSWFAFPVALIVVVFGLRFSFALIDKLLSTACGSERLRLRSPIPARIARLRTAKRKARNFLWTPFVVIAILFLRNNALRRSIRRIRSLEFEERVRKLYVDSLANWRVVRRITRYASRRAKCQDTDAVVSVVQRLVSRSQFRLVAPYHTMTAGLLVCYERAFGGAKREQLIFGAELWMLLLHRWGERAFPWDVAPARIYEWCRGILTFRKSKGVPMSSDVVSRGYLARCLNLLILQAVAHEAVHVVQEIFERLILIEYQAGRGVERLSWRTYFKAELAAHAYGSPALLFAMVTFFPLMLLPSFYNPQ